MYVIHIQFLERLRVMMFDGEATGSVVSTTTGGWHSVSGFERPRQSGLRV